MGNFKEDVEKVKAFVFDVDGVFTDGGIGVDPNGEFIRKYNVKDGFAVKTAVDKGYPVAIISGGRGRSITERFEAMGVKDIYTGTFEKLDAMKKFMSKYGLEFSDLLYMGDDIPDIEAMINVGMPVCPKDASSEVVTVSRYVSGFAGGEGCVRDIVEQVLRSHNNWFTVEFKTEITSE